MPSLAFKRACSWSVFGRPDMMLAFVKSQVLISKWRAGIDVYKFVVPATILLFLEILARDTTVATLARLD